MDWNQQLGWNQAQIEDLRSLGYSLIQQGVYEQALVFFEALSLLNPNSAYDLQTLGAIRLQMGDSMPALDLFDRALKLDPNNAQIKLNRAKALFALGYRRQGILQAKEIEALSQGAISDSAKALLLIHQ